jgi:hypothetical protein
MSDLTPPSSPPPVALAAPPLRTATDLLSAPLTPEAALQAIEEGKADKDFYKRLHSNDPKIAGEAKAYWNALFKAAYPTPPQATLENVEDVHGNQEVMRRSERMESGLAALRAMGITDQAALDEVRRQQPVAADEQQFAREEITRLKQDKAFVRRYLDGDREARAIFTRLHQVISLPTARTATTYPTK